jgi:hypothetical protein
MNHRAELAIHKLLEDVLASKKQMSMETIEGVASDIKDAMVRQFGTKNDRGDFRLRMSNIGKPSCQLWFDKNHPEKALPKGNNFLMTMMIGDIVEAVFKGILKEAKIDYQDSEEVALELEDGTKVKGTYDLVLDDCVDDIKSASDWSYKNKFDSFESLANGDSFGYVGQLVGYAKASGKNIGGWWVVNKSTGQFKYVSAGNADTTHVLDNIEKTVKQARAKDLVRCFEPEEETFRGKATGNLVLNKNCTFCDFRYTCWETLHELPAQKSLAKEPKMVQYIKVA